MMAICHTAVPERTDGRITYQAASPGQTDSRHHIKVRDVKFVFYCIEESIHGYQPFKIF